MTISDNKIYNDISEQWGDLMKAEKFLEMYREVEELLSLQYAGTRRYNSAVMEYINDRSNPYYREELNTCREIRNLLAHHADIGGKSIVEPSDEVLELLSKILRYISDPPLVLSCATPFERLMTTTPVQRAFSVMHKMRGRGFSHVPVLDNGKFVGMFSISIPFAHALEQEKCLTRDFAIADFGSLLQIENHCTERYLFAPRTMTVRQAGKAFETVGNDKKRLAMILITEHGNVDENILGVLTPFDVLHVNENE